MRVRSCGLVRELNRVMPLGHTDYNLQAWCLLSSGLGRKDVGRQVFSMVDTTESLLWINSWMLSANGILLNLNHVITFWSRILSGT